MEAKLYEQSGKDAGTVNLPGAVFGLPKNKDLVYQVVTIQEMNRRQTTAHARGRSEVRGGGKKPWRQKGTGRARHGSIRSPIWKGGGVTHGPLKEKNYEKKVNKKMALKALATVLSGKLKDGEVVFLREIALAAPKTKEAVAILKNVSGISGYAPITKKSVVVMLPEHGEKTFRAFRNIPNLGVIEARNISAFDLLRFRYVIMPEPAISVLEKRILGKGASKKVKREILKTGNSQ